ncbi:hypothetical protein TNCV_3418791 [Trichonephila clavipes]|nr:hypothetical protein TNCV_3418791 [Trichonephila clavipes]
MLRLGVTQQAISHNLKPLGMTQKQGYEPKLRRVECRSCTRGMLGINERVSSLRIVSCHEKWICYDYTKKNKSGVPLGHVVYLVSYIMRCSNRMKPLLEFSTELIS